MKNLIIIVSLLSLSFGVYSQDTFCDGWEEGYKHAYEDNNEFLGIIPICPILGINQKDTYRTGYNAGYKKASKKIGTSTRNNTFSPEVNKDKKFCDGWEEGYKQAHEDNNEFLGIIPICPIPGINQKDSYRSGYNSGYKKALKNID